MKNVTKMGMKILVSLFIIIPLFTGNMFAQDCKVLKESISGTYEGDCKKGLANGQGTAKGVDTYTGEFKKGLPHGLGKYTWADGDIYEGNFTNGLMDGEGKRINTLDGKVISETTGYWEEDEYLGQYKEAYKVHVRSPKVTSVRITKVKKPAEADKNAVFVTIQKRGSTEFNQNIGVDVSVGRHSETQQSTRSTRINVVIFPYRAVISYQGERVDVEFYQEGTYEMTIDLNME